MNIKCDINIDKDRAAIWKYLSDINKWGLWSPLIDHSVIYGPFKEGTSFKCSSGKWELDCRIAKIDPEHRLIAYARTVGLELVLSWQLDQTMDGTKAVLSLDASGWIATLFKKRLAGYLEYSLQRWLGALKSRTEKGEPIKIESDEDEDKLPGRSSTVFTTPLSFLSDIKKSKERRKGRAR